MPNVFPTSELKGFIQLIQDSFETWIATGSNPFIHAKLYDQKFPTSVQVAYATLSAYIHRNAANADMILRIVNERANDLVVSNAPESGMVSGSSPGIMEQLGRVHALFIYQTIGLLDGEIRSRHLAETHFPIFIRWLGQLLESASDAIPRSVFSWELDAVMLQASASPPSLREGIWQAWIVAESIRRTWLIGMGLEAAYMGLKQGWTPCPGGVMFTSREGLWDAKSAYVWGKTCAETDVRFMQRFDVERLFVEAAPGEVDGFGKMILEITFGKERMEEWLCRERG
jgi:hypothetical protein